MEEINSLKYIIPEVIVPTAIEPDKLLSGEDVGFNSATTNYARNAEVRSVPWRYNNVDINPFDISESQYELEADKQQEGWDQAIATFKNTGLQVVAGVLAGIGSDDPMQQASFVLQQAGENYSNIFLELANNIQEYANEELPVFNGGSSMWTSEYWANAITNMGYSGGLALWQAAKVAMVFGSGGTGGILGALGYSSKALSAGKIAMDTLNMARNVGTLALAVNQGIGNSYLNAVQNGDEVYQKYRDAGYDEATAKELAGKAAQKSFNTDLAPSILLGLGTMGLATNLKSFGKAGIAESFKFGISDGLENFVGKALPKAVRDNRLVNWLGQGVFEGVEEVKEGITTKMTEQEADIALGKDYGRSLGDYMTGDKALFDAFLQGGFGGLVFGAATNVRSNRENKRFEADMKTREENFSKSVLANIVDVARNITVARQNGNIAEEEFQKKRLSVQNTLSALMLDEMSGKPDFNYGLYITQLEEIQKALDAGDWDKLKAMKVVTEEEASSKEGIEELEKTFNYIKDEYPKLIAQAREVKSKFDSYGNKAISSTWKGRLVAQEMAIEYNKEVLARETAISGDYSKIEGYNELTPEQKDLFQKKLDHAALFEIETAKTKGKLDAEKKGTKIVEDEDIAQNRKEKREKLLKVTKDKDGKESFSGDIVEAEKNLSKTEIAAVDAMIKNQRGTDLFYSKISATNAQLDLTHNEKKLAHISDIKNQAKEDRKAEIAELRNSLFAERAGAFAMDRAFRRLKKIGDLSEEEQAQIKSMIQKQKEAEITALKEKKISDAKIKEEAKKIKKESKQVIPNEENVAPKISPNPTPNIPSNPNTQTNTSQNTIYQNFIRREEEELYAGDEELSNLVEEERAKLNPNRDTTQRDITYHAIAEKNDAKKQGKASPINTILADSDKTNNPPTENSFIGRDVYYTVEEDTQRQADLALETVAKGYGIRSYKGMSYSKFFSNLAEKISDKALLKESFFTWTRMWSKAKGENPSVDSIEALYEKLFGEKINFKEIGALLFQQLKEGKQPSLQEVLDNQKELIAVNKALTESNNRLAQAIETLNNGSSKVKERKAKKTLVKELIKKMEAGQELTEEEANLLENKGGISKLLQKEKKKKGDKAPTNMATGKMRKASKSVLPANPETKGYSIFTFFGKNEKGETTNEPVIADFSKGHVNSWMLARPGLVPEGTEFYLSIDEEADIFEGDEEHTATPIPFKESSKNTAATYRDYVPIVVVVKVGDKEVAVTQIDFPNRPNLKGQDTTIAELRAIRDEVLNRKAKGLEPIRGVVGKREAGTYISNPDTSKSVGESHPNAIIGYRQDNIIITSKGGVHYGENTFGKEQINLLESENDKQEEQPNIGSGDSVMLVPGANPNEYRAFKIVNPRISETKEANQIVTTILQLVRIFTESNYANHKVGDKVLEIEKITGVKDLRSLLGIRNALRQYTYATTIAETDKPQRAITEINEKAKENGVSKKEGEPIIVLQQVGNSVRLYISTYTSGEPQIYWVTTKDGKITEQGEQGLAVLETALREKGRLNFLGDLLSAHTLPLLINDKREVSSMEMKYEDFYKTNAKTPIESFYVDKEGKVSKKANPSDPDGHVTIIQFHTPLKFTNLEEYRPVKEKIDAKVNTGNPTRNDPKGNRVSAAELIAGLQAANKAANEGTEYKPTTAKEETKPKYTPEQQAKIDKFTQEANSLYQRIGGISNNAANDGVLFSIEGSEITGSPEKRQKLNKHKTQDKQDIIKSVTSIAFNQAFRNGKKTTFDEATKIVDATVIKIYEAAERENAETETFISKLESAIKEDPALKETLEEVLFNTYSQKSRIENVISNIKEIREEAVKVIKHYNKISSVDNIEEEAEIEEDFEDNLDEAPERSYDTANIELNPKNSASSRMRAFLIGIRDKDGDGNTKVGLLNVPKFIGWSNAYDTLQKVLAGVEPNLVAMKNRLQENSTKYPWMKQVIEMLDNETVQIQKEFVTNFAAHQAKIKFILFSDKGGMKASIRDVDGNRTKETVNTWKRNLNISRLVSPTQRNGESVYRVNREVAAELLERYNAMAAKPNSIDEGELKSWLKDFGIELSDSAIAELKKTGIPSEDGALKTLPLNVLFSPNIKGSIFVHLKDFLQRAGKEELIYSDTEDAGSPFKDINNAAAKLAEIENKYTSSMGSNTVRDGGKTVSTIVRPNLVTDTVDDFQRDTEATVEKYSKKPYNKHSMWMKLFDKPIFKKLFYVNHLALSSLKRRGSKNKGDSNINSLGRIDHEIVKTAHFFDMERPQIGGKFGDVNIRTVDMFFPSLSDKSQMLTTTTAALDLGQKGYITFDEEGKMIIPDQVLNAVYTQLIEPDLDRITNFNSKQASSNIKGYDTAARMFLSIPSLNTAVAEDGNGNEVPLIQLMYSDPTTYTKEYVEGIAMDYFKETIRNLLLAKAEAKFNEWQTFNIASDSERDVKINKDYLNRLGALELEQKLRVAALDYTTNYMVSNANVNMLFSGDLAQYGTDAIANYFQEGTMLLKEPNKDVDTYAKILRDIVGITYNKRLAGDLAPGKTSDSQESPSYIHIFLEDQKLPANNIKYLANLHYPNNTELKTLVEKLSDENTRKATVSEIKEKFPRIAPFLEIEASDSQEYATATEYMNNARNYGLIPDDVYQRAMEKIAMQKAAEKQGKPIPAEAYITREDLDIILQPFKMVYTGFYDDDINEMMRMVYLKNSTIPLIPQITQGQQIDGLRKLMEKVEAKTNKPVKASYQSGNKVGAVKSAIKPYDADGNFNEGLLEDIDSAETFESSFTGMSSLELERRNLRLQQDMPYKGDKEQISVITQTLKLLMSNGMISESGFVLDGKEYTGKELLNLYNEAYGNYSKALLDSYLGELGIKDVSELADKAGEPYRKLTTLLKREAEDRGYAMQSIEGIELIEETYEDGYRDFRFNFPLWLLPNADRIESVLNSLASKVARGKMKGLAYITVSEAGFAESAEGKSNIIYTNAYTGKLLGARFDEETGQMLPNQVFAPSYFRDNQGNKIQLLQKGKPNPEYVTVGEDGKLFLKEDKFDKSNYTMPASRIPVSDHGSMASYEIVGFLPEEAGDIIVLPNNILPQKGSDNDGDKENSYHMHTYTDENGFNRPITQEVVDEIKNTIQSEGVLNIVGHEGVKEAIAFLTAKYAKQKEVRGGKTSYFLKQKDQDKIFTQLDKMLAENQFIKINQAVLSNPSNSVQQKINKALDMSPDENSANIISEKVNKIQDPYYFTVHDEAYQRELHRSGVVGKKATAIYAQAMTFLASMQSIPDKVIGFIGINSKTGETYNKSFVIGDQKSNGVMNGTKTNDGYRTKAEAIGIAINTATDNIKVGVLGKVGINNTTINVDTLMTFLGFDFGTVKIGNKEERVKLSHLLLSQPIIREFVQKLETQRGVTGGYDSFAEDNIADELYMKYGVGENDLYNKDVFDRNSTINKELTAQNMYNALDQGEPQDYDPVQIEALRMFMTMRSYSEKLIRPQKALGTLSKGLGKSFFETLDLYDSIGEIAEAEKEISNIGTLIGDYKANTTNLTDLDRQALMDQGYKLIKDVWVKPTTPAGHALLNSVPTAREVYKKILPHASEPIQEIMNRLWENMGKEKKNSNQVVTEQYEMLKEIKKYIFSMMAFRRKGTDASSERSRLFIDKPGHYSLARYLKEVLATSTDPNVNEYLKGNPLLERLEYTINVDGKPSLITFRNSKEEGFDEDMIYNALFQLNDSRVPLPPFNGIAYSTTSLVYDLVTYAYLEGGVQEGIQFVKFIPIAFPNALEFGQIQKFWGNYDNSSFESDLVNILGINNNSKISNFERQHAQNNPHKYPRLKSKDVLRSEELDTDEIITQKSRGAELMPYTFLSYQDRGEYEMYEYAGAVNVTDEEGGTQVFYRYKKLSTLGSFGMSEYDPNNQFLNSVLDKDMATPQGKTIKVVEKKIQTVALRRILQDTKLNLRAKFKEIAFFVTGNPDLFTNKSFRDMVEFMSSLPDTAFAGVNFEINNMTDENGESIASAGYNPSTKTVTLSEGMLESSNDERIIKNLLHETFHHLTADYVNTFLDRDGKYKTESIPANIYQLKSLFNKAVASHPNQAGIKALQKKLEKHSRGETQVFTAEEKALYPYTSIHEFIAGLTTNRDFQLAMDKIKYTNENVTVTGKFLSILKNILMSVFSTRKLHITDTVLNQGLITIFDIAEKTSSLKDYTKTDMETVRWLNENISYTNNIAPQITEEEKSTLKDFKEDNPKELFNITCG